MKNIVELYLDFLNEQKVSHLKYFRPKAAKFFKKQLKSKSVKEKIHSALDTHEKAEKLGIVDAVKDHNKKKTNSKKGDKK